MMSVRPLLRALAPAGVAVGAVLALTPPAEAFCVSNVSKMTVEVRLRSMSPLAAYKKVLKSGERSCCDWLYRSCNPRGGRNARLVISVRGWGHLFNDYYCSGPIPQRTMIVSDGEITVVDDPGQLGALRCDSRDFQGSDVQLLRQGAPARPIIRTRPSTTPTARPTAPARRSPENPR